MTILSTILLAFALLLPAAADARSPRHHATTEASQSNESQLVEHGRYTNKNGETVHSPAHTKDGKAPAGASAQCGDGTYSFSRSHRGTCSHHGGVASWL
jgi:hypothetical protein